MKKQRILIYVFVTVVFAIGVYVHGNLYLYRTALKNVNIPSITVSENSYSIKRGRIIHNDTGNEINRFAHPLLAKSVYILANFYQSVDEEPVFVDENFDSSNFQKKVEKLARYQDEINNKFDNHSNFMPTDFLSSLAETATSYQEFIQKPSRETSANLISKYQNSQRLYLQEANALYDNFADTKPDSLLDDSKIYYLNSYTTPAVVRSDLNIISGNATSLLAEVKLKSDYLSGRKIYRGASIPKFSKKVSDKDQYNLLDKEDLVLYQNVKTLEGPYLASTSCLARDGKEMPFYLYNAESWDDEVVQVKLATENYYEKSEEGSKYYNMGYLFEPVPEGNTYRCPDLGYQASILTLDRYLKKYKGPILGGVNTESLTSSEKVVIREDIDFENNFYKSETYSAGDMDTLKNVYREVYHILGSHSLSDNDIDIYADILAREKMLGSKQTDISSIFATGFYIDHLLRWAEENPTQVRTDNSYYLYAVRSVYSLSYFTFSDYVWFLREKPKYNFSLFDDENKSVYKYSDLVKTYSREDINKWRELLYYWQEGNF